MHLKTVMIVQSSQSEAKFVMMQADHARAAAQFAGAFVNEAFARLEPRNLLLDITKHHDEGWAEVDAALHFDDQTGLPYHLFDTPFDLSLKTNIASPDFNERRHPLCGILSSMHTCGFYNGRYGLMETKKLDALPDEQKAPVRTMLENEMKRQERLKVELEAQGKAVWADEAFLLRRYYLLQFFDLLALYFHLEDETARAPHTFHHVPMKAGKITDIRVEPLGEGRYRLSPYPFANAPLTVQTKGRYLEPQESRDDLVKHFGETDPEYQKVTLVA